MCPYPEQEHPIFEEVLLPCTCLVEAGAVRESCLKLEN